MIFSTASLAFLNFCLSPHFSHGSFICILQQQHLIELIRLRETEAALEFAQSQLAEQGEESRECLTEMERTLALLAFDNPEESPFGDLLNMMQRQKVEPLRTFTFLTLILFTVKLKFQICWCKLIVYIQFCL